MNITHSVIRWIGVGALAVTGTAISVGDHAAAASTPLTIVASDGVSQPNGDGAFASVDVVYPSSTRPRPATATFSLRSYDDSFPAADLCEPATAEIEIVGDHKTTMTLVATGKVCGQYPSDATSPPIQNFIGRYLVVAGPARFAGDDGFVNIVVGDGWSYLFAIDT